MTRKSEMDYNTVRTEVEKALCRLEQWIEQKNHLKQSTEQRNHLKQIVQTLMTEAGERATKKLFLIEEKGASQGSINISISISDNIDADDRFTGYTIMSYGTGDNFTIQLSYRDKTKWTKMNG